MRHHYLKLNTEFCDDVLSGDKPFEVRKNDRGYQKGDCIRFKSINNMGFRQYHKVEEREYEITYVLSGWGIKEDYVVFGIKEIKTKNIKED